MGEEHGRQIVDDDDLFHMDDAGERKLLSRYGIWLLVELCKTQEDVPIVSYKLLYYLSLSLMFWLLYFFTSVAVFLLLHLFIFFRVGILQQPQSVFEGAHFFAGSNNFFLLCGGHVHCHLLGNVSYPLKRHSTPM